MGSNLEDAKVLFAREASFNDFFDLKAAVYFTFYTCERYKNVLNSNVREWVMQLHSNDQKTLLYILRKLK